MSSKYMVGEIPLDRYCKENKLNFKTQSNRIRDYIKRYPKLSEQDAIKLAISRCGSHFTYWYNNHSLFQYCAENDKNYNSMLSRIESIKKLYPNVDNNEIVRVAIEDYSDNGIKYFYNGIPLVAYCQLHPEFNYSSILTYIRRKRIKSPNFDTQLIINSYFKEEHLSHTYHIIDGSRLREYCDNHGIVYNSILSSISKMRKNVKCKDLSDHERLKIAITKYKRPYLFYKGVSLFVYCKENDYSYNTVYNYVVKMIETNPEITYEEAIESAFSTIKRYGIKYYYNGIPLVNYCFDQQLNIYYVRDRILLLLQSENMSVDQAIEESLHYYENKKYLNNLNRIFNYLKCEKSLNEEIIKLICSYLKIDYQNVIFLKNKFTNISDIIYFIWFFYDINMDGLISVSEEKEQEVFSCANAFPSNKNDIININLNLLIGMYKANIFDTRYLIIVHQENFHYYTLIQLLNSYSITINQEDTKDIINDTNLFLLELIEKNNNNNIAMVISYIKKSIKGFIMNRLLNYINSTAKIISLNSPTYKNSNSTNERLLIDELMYKKINNLFSDEIQEIISTLDNTTKSFIYYKYYQCLPYDEIASILDMNMEQLLIFEKNILAILYENKSLKKLVKIYE